MHCLGKEIVLGGNIIFPMQRSMTKGESDPYRLMKIIERADEK